MRQTIILLLVLVLISCNPFSADKKGSVNNEDPVAFDLDKIQEKGKITAIFDNNSTNYFIYKGQPVGYEYELLSRYCKEIDIELEIIIVEDIQEAFDLLNRGEADILAYFLAITEERKKRIAFTDMIVSSRQVLVQRKPDNWRRMSSSSISNKVIRNQFDLIGKDIYVRPNSSYIERLDHLSKEIGGRINIKTLHEDIETEELISLVLNGKIDYTIADEDLALVNAAYYPELDVETPISFPQQIAWGIRKNAPMLKSSLDDYISDIKKSGFLQIIYNRYFKVSRQLVERATSDYSSISGENISNFDDTLQAWADSIGWDWKLLASMIYQESRFNPDIVSWAGAIGLMQIMPLTGTRFGATNLHDPKQNIMAGVRFIKYLDNYWGKSVTDSIQRTKFIMASYNIGLGHIQDAVKIAEMTDRDTQVWDDNVEEALKLKSSPAWFRKKEIQHGYARGNAVVTYVEDIWKRYEEYQLHFN